MDDPIEFPKVSYAKLQREEKEFVDRMTESLFMHAQRIPSLKRLHPEKAKETVIGLLDLGLLRIRREGARAWWEIHDGRKYIPV